MSAKEQCPVCKKLFTVRTLDKYSGTCGRCVIKKQINVNNVVHGPAAVTATHKKKIWKLFEKQIEENKNNCLLCNESEITLKNMSVGYDKDRIMGGQLSMDNCMPICCHCSVNIKGYSFAEYKAMKKIVVPPKCYLCGKHEFKYIYKCCNIKMCADCVKSDDKYSDGFATLFCPFVKNNTVCGKEIGMTRAMIY